MVFRVVFNVGYWTIGVKDYCDGVLKKILTKEQYDTTKLIIARNEPTNNSLYIETTNNLSSFWKICGVGSNNLSCNNLCTQKR